MHGEQAAYRVVEVGADDVGELARMRLDWSVAQGMQPSDDFAAQMDDWWQRQGALRRAWVVRDGGDVTVAMANVAIFERMPRPGQPPARWAYVGNVWVEEEHRRRGVGTLLMEHILDWCRAEHMQRIVLNPSEMSVPLYRSLGFRPAADLLRLDL